jgi:hypothetical protein
MDQPNLPQNVSDPTLPSSTMATVVLIAGILGLHSFH